MLYRVIGAAGSGKTEYMLSQLGRAIKKGKRCFVIVPEQQSVDYESMLCDRFGDSVNLCCEVLNFERLPNRVAREFGGLAVNNIDKGGACGLLSLLSEALKDDLKEYSAVAGDTDFAFSLFALISKMKMSLVTPQKVAEAASDPIISGNLRLSDKLADIAKIYNEYEKRFGDGITDPRDALTVLADELPDKPFFRDSCVFIDGYYTFTGQEYAIIREMIAQSAETYISFTIDSTRSFFKENASAAERIRKLSPSQCTDWYTSEPRRYESEQLAYIERNIWRSGASKMNGDDGSVSLISAKNRFDEVEAAASEILSFVRLGGRFRDITLLTGNTDTYSGIVDSVFSRAGIPVYLSAKEELAAKPLFAFLISSLNVIIEDFSLRSMKRYIKSGYTDLSVSESDALLGYAAAWKLRSRAWYSDEEWTLDPEGYREGDLTPRGARLLATANASRAKVVPALTALRDELSVKDLTVSKGIRALYAHLMACKADEKLRKSAERALKNGERERSEREIQLWKILITMIDQLDSVCGDINVTPKRLLSLIRLMCDCYSLGAIPASNDSVTFGDASLIRAGGKKMVLILGACDGEFPASASKGGFFNRDEAVELEEAGLCIADTMEKQLNESRFFVYAALSAPTRKLTLLYPRSELGGGELRPSAAWISVRQMFPDLKEREFSEENMLYSPDTVASRFPRLCEGEYKNAVESALIERNIPFFRKDPSVFDPVSRIDFADDKLLLSPSRFERYMLCPFSFFGRYLLDLKEDKQNEFAMPEIGNFAHKILEQFMRHCVSSGAFVKPTEEERKSLIESISKQYFLDVVGQNAAEDKRFMHTYGNMVRTISFVASSLCDEFAESKFTPCGFEFKIGLKDADIPAVEYDSDGKKVLLRGSIDRVDRYVADGVEYVRVIDYKTYAKTFSANLVACGIDTQLLHYLFAYCDNKGAKPAGVLYYTVALPNIQISGRETPEEIKKMLAKEIGRSGLLLDNADVVFAMSPDCSFVPVMKKSDGSGIYTRSNNLLDEDGFNGLSKQLRSQVEELARGVFCGNMDIAPNDADGKAEPCKNCSLADLCRNKKKEGTEEDEADRYTE